MCLFIYVYMVRCWVTSTRYYTRMPTFIPIFKTFMKCSLWCSLEPVQRRLFVSWTVGKQNGLSYYGFERGKNRISQKSYKRKRFCGHISWIRCQQQHYGYISDQTCWQEITYEQMHNHGATSVNCLHGNLTGLSTINVKQYPNNIITDHNILW